MPTTATKYLAKVRNQPSAHAIIGVPVSRSNMDKERGQHASLCCPQAYVLRPNITGSSKPLL